jgi:large subunit ribosomal protein L30
MVEQTNKQNNETPKMVAVIRIAGMVKVRKDVAETLDRLRLRRKYACVVVDANNINVAGMLKRVKQYIAFGEIDVKTLEKLVKERAESIEGRKKKIEVNASEVAKGLLAGKKLKDFKLKGFFRLHPPRKGIDSKIQYPKGVLGNNKKDINKLIERML